MYKQTRHHRSERNIEEFRTSIFDHQRPFRRKMSAMVGNFVHKVRSSRVLEPLIGPKLLRNAAISEICGSLFLVNHIVATRRSCGRARSTTARARCLASLLTYAPCLCPVSHLPSPEAPENKTRRRPTWRSAAPVAHRAAPIAASSAESGAVPGEAPGAA